MNDRSIKKEKVFSNRLLRLFVHRAWVLGLYSVLFTGSLFFAIAQESRPLRERSTSSLATFELMGVLPHERIQDLSCAKDSFLVILPLAPDVPFHTSTLVGYVASDTEKPKMQMTGHDIQDQYVLVFRLNQLDESELALLRDSNDGRWNEFSLFDATLIAEGQVTSTQRQPYQTIMTTYQNELREEIQNIRDPMTQVRTVFEFLHRRILTNRYDLNRSSLALALDTGIFNCVSATILFNYLADEIGLKVTGLETTGHAKSRILFDRYFLDIETTCTQWELLPDRLRPRTVTHTVARPLNQVESGEVNYPIVQGDMREIDFVQLTATVYYNRGVDFSQSGQNIKALEAYIKAVHLDPSNATILGNLKATLNNWAIELVTTKKNFPESIRITECSLVLDPDFEQSSTNLPIFYQHWMAELKKELRFHEADYLEKMFQTRFLSN